MRKFSFVLATAGLTASLGAYAALPTDAAPFQLVVPNLKSGVEIILEGLLLRPSNSNLDFADTVSLVSTTGPVTTTFTENNSVNTPNYDLGFRVGLGYIFPNSGNDVQADWYHFDHSHTDTINAAANQAIVPVPGSPNTISPAFLDRFLVNGVFTNGGAATPVTATASSDTNFKLDAVDLDAGQYLDIGTRLETRLFAGLRFARVENNTTDTYSGLEGLTNTSSGGFSTLNIFLTEQDIFDSKFTGVGPRFGVDSSYHLGWCFGLVGHVSAALLVGTVETNTSYTNTETFGTTTGAVATPITEVTNLSSDNSRRVVPNFDAKLGLDYSHPFEEDGDSVISIEGGYFVTYYVDAVDQVNVDQTRTTSSVAFDGPYLNLNFKM